jgi:hypothetical protein
VGDWWVVEPILGGRRLVMHKFVNMFITPRSHALIGAYGMKDQEKMKVLAKSMMDDRAQAGQAVNVVVSLMVSGLVAAFLLPVAIEEIVNVDTTNWGSGATSLWNIMDLIIVLGAFLFMIQMAVRQN